MLCNYEECKMKENPIFKNISASSAKSSFEAVTDPFVKSLQAGILYQKNTFYIFISSCNLAKTFEFTKV